MSNYIIPPIGAKGKFSFKSPFDTNAKTDTEYTVHSIRSIKELIDSGEDPEKYIYQSVGLSATDMNTDLENSVPIIILSSGTNNYIYVPADCITSLPDISGVKYQQKMLAINVGHLPIDYSLDTVKEAIKDAVLEITGIESTVEAIPTSAIKYVATEESDTYLKLIDGRKISNFSYRTRYKMLKTTYDKLVNQLSQLEKCMIAKWK